MYVYYTFVLVPVDNVETRIACVYVYIICCNISVPILYVVTVDTSIICVRYIQGVPGGMCHTSGECSLC